ncbi:coxsackievirus and adenovirus receptor-like isoform X3 [Perca fluviatilis]|uniref:coxsackievirus and adenovirus receptor-like isoform X3 n=1 Tax=Perca fluviatilis TaxID=8168 RepID=UPI0019654C88|nr:coxsackievirus and adenovirus receptor-like isoform X3 [Perca fluviatilis]
MAPFLLLLFLLSEAASGELVVPVNPGDDVILPCQAAGSSIRVVEWTRPDLKPDTVLYYRGGHLTPDDQHPSFKDRVELVDRDLKDGDVSLILKNVSRHDAGTYKCRVKSGVTNQIRLIRTIRLQVPDEIVVPVPGDDVILPCQANDYNIRVVEWTRADLEPDTVLLYRDGNLETYYQHPSFKNRVELVDRDLKDGDVSLTLKNVNINDGGTYECRVKPAGSRRRKRGIIDSEPIRTIRLQVPEPADSNSGHPKDGNSMNDDPEDGNSSPVDIHLGLAAGGLVVASAVVGVLIYRRRNNKRSGPPAAAADDDDDDDDAAADDDDEAVSDTLV